ncbi:hypothetical protein ABIE44_002155 [Marmoricola sp. OAE513]|uniref:hypothetical protein n=1 Tax=Marmoricola sp. OAE513 TaxID=2817894 RepID=UPI001AE5D17E
MRSKLISALTVIGAVTVLVLAANTVALAATGSSLLAGKKTTAGKVTTLKRTTSGTTFKVLTKSTANAPFAVNGKGRVTNLNADKVDGLDAAALQNRAVSYTLPAFPAGTQLQISLPGLPSGLWQGTFALVANGSDPVGCEFVTSDNKSYGLVFGVDSGSFSSANGTALVDIRGGKTVKLHCFSSSNFLFNTNSATPQVYFTRVDGVTTKAGLNITP